MHLPRPNFTPEDACRLARDCFGLVADAIELPGYLDQNFRLQAGGGGCFVLKIAHAEEDPAVLRLQQAALDHLAGCALPLRTPRVCLARTGEPVVQATARDGRTHLVWMVTFLPGRFLAEVRPHPPALLRRLGYVLGRLDAALAGFSHPAMRRALPWDLQRYTALHTFLDDLDGRRRRALVKDWLERFAERVGPVWPALRRSVIHNDANDHNVLVDSGTAAITGLIDFGDMVHTLTVAEPAIAAAYVMLGTTDPIGTAAQVVAGYHAAYPLTGAEVRAFFGLIAMRLCTSVCLSAYRRRQDPHNAYLTVSEQPAWEMLERLAAVSFDEAEATFRRACALP